MANQNNNGLEWMDDIQVGDLNWLNDIHAMEVDGNEFQEVYRLLDGLSAPEVDQMVRNSPGLL